MGGISLRRFRDNNGPPPQYEKGASRLLQPPQPAERFIGSHFNSAYKDALCLTSDVCAHV